MKITVTPEAIHWFKTEMNLQVGDGIRFFGKVYGKTNVHDGFSVGIERGIASDPLVKQKIDGLIFSADKSDDWFFAGFDLKVDYDAQIDEPVYLFESITTK